MSSFGDVMMQATCDHCWHRSPEDVVHGPHAPQFCDGPGAAQASAIQAAAIVICCHCASRAREYTIERYVSIVPEGA